MKHAQNLGYFGLCAILLGCGAEPAGEGGDVVGEAVLAWGEQSCAEDAVADDEISSDYCGNESSVSADGSYGSTDCPGQYVVEFGVGSSVSGISGFADGWGDTLPSTQAACEHAHSLVSAWQRVNGTWQALDSMLPDQQTGVWSGGACSFADPNFNQVSINADLVRVAARAYQCPTTGLCLNPTVKKARAFAWGTPCAP